jgi:hypothetical protein
VEDPEERAAMALIVRLRDDEGLSWHQIRKRLMLEKIFTRNKTFWHLSRIQLAYMAERKLRSQTNGTVPPPDGSSSPEPSPSGSNLT